jgi:hypothetical protein
VTDPTALEVAAIFGLLTFGYVRFTQFANIPNRLLIVADAVGLAVFTVLGCNTALTNNAGALITVIMGMVTGSGGGIIRDVFSAEIRCFRKEIYATCLVGGGVITIPDFRRSQSWRCWGAAVTLVIRLGAIYWGWLPGVDSNSRRKPSLISNVRGHASCGQSSFTASAANFLACSSHSFQASSVPNPAFTITHPFMGLPVIKWVAKANPSVPWSLLLQPENGNPYKLANILPFNKWHTPNIFFFVFSSGHDLSMRASSSSLYAMIRFPL